jgi:hypothetical protein
MRRACELTARDDVASLISGTMDVLSGADERRPLASVRADRVEMRSVEWIKKPFLQASAFQLLVGPKGVGKGTWLARTMSLMTHGAFDGKPRNILVLSAEDSDAIDTVPRLEAAGADRSRIEIVTDEFLLPAHLDRLEQQARMIGTSA